MRVILENSRDWKKHIEVEMNVLPRVGEDVELTDYCEQLARKDGKGDALDPSPRWIVKSVVHAFMPVGAKSDDETDEPTFLLCAVPKVVIENEDAIE